MNRQTARVSIPSSNRASVLFHDPFRDRQAEARTRIVSREVGIEDPRQILGAYSGAAVRHLDGHLAIGRGHPYFHLASVATRPDRVLQMIAKMTGLSMRAVQAYLAEDIDMTGERLAKIADALGLELRRKARRTKGN